MSTAVPRVLMQSSRAALAGLGLVWLPWMARNAAVHDSFSADGNAGSTLVGRAMRHDPGFAFENPTIRTPLGSGRARSCGPDAGGS